MATAYTHNTHGYTHTHCLLQTPCFQAPQQIHALPGRAHPGSTGVLSASPAKVVHSHLCQADSAPLKQAEGLSQARPPCAPRMGCLCFPAL